MHAGFAPPKYRESTPRLSWNFWCVKTQLRSIHAKHFSSYGYVASVLWAPRIQLTLNGWPTNNEGLCICLILRSVFITRSRTHPLKTLNSILYKSERKTFFSMVSRGIISGKYYCAGERSILKHTFLLFTDASRPMITCRECECSILQPKGRCISQDDRFFSRHRYVRRKNSLHLSIILTF